MMAGYSAAQAPIFTLYGDGTVIFRNPMEEPPAAQGSTTAQRTGQQSVTQRVPHRYYTPRRQRKGGAQRRGTPDGVVRSTCLPDGDSVHQVPKRT